MKTNIKCFLLVSFFIIPSLAFASWWNPFTWNWNFSSLINKTDNTANVEMATSANYLKSINTFKEIPANLMRFKDVFNKNLNIGISDLNNNYTDYIGSFDKVIPLTKTNLVGTDVVAGQFFTDYGKYFGITNSKTDLVKNYINSDTKGQNYLFYNQQYKGIRVYGGEMIVQVDNNNQVHSGSGKYIPNISSVTVPSIKQAKAETLAKVVGLNEKLNKPTVDSAELVIYNAKVFDMGATDKNYLAWNIIMKDNNNWSERLFIDAQTGKVLAEWPLVKNAKITGINNSDWLNLNTARALNGSNQINRIVWNCSPDGCMQNSTATTSVFTDPGNARSEGQRPVGDAEIDNIYDYLGNAFNYYKNTFDYWGANGMGGIGHSNSTRWPLLKTTVYGHFIATSTYGRCTNCWGGSDALEFCDGTVNQMTVAHEYQHAVSDFNKDGSGGFDYLNESGAIEEAYADFFGNAVTRFATGIAPWKIGGINQNTNKFEIWRNFTDPTNASTSISGIECPCPEQHYGAQFYCGGNWDKGGVHRDSTVITHMASVLVNGGNLGGCAVNPVSEDKVEQIFYHAFRHNLTKTPNFKEFYSALIRSCGTLYGWQSNDCKNIAIAMQGAQIDQQKACGSAGDVPSCKYTTFDLRGQAQFGFLSTVANLSTTTIPKIDTTIINKTVPEPISNTCAGAYDPVCSEDNVTYTNECHLKKVGLKMKHKGVCIHSLAPTQKNTYDESQENNDSVSSSSPIIPVVENTQIQEPVSIPEVEVRTPSFTVDVIQNDKKVTINGVLNYYGKGAKCSGPRYFDPIIVRWGQIDDHPTLNSDNTFSVTHDYNVKNTSYDLSVSIINSCFGSYTFHKTLTF